MIWKIVFRASAEKALNRLPDSEQDRILLTTNRLASNPRPKGVKKLSGQEEMYRIRIGDYRVVYHLKKAQLTVLVLRVAHRKDAYR